MFRLASLTLVLLAGPGYAQVPGMDACSAKCGDKLTDATKRCGSDSKCLQRGVQQMDACNMQCATRTSKAPQMPKKCPGANGKMVSCAEMMKLPPPPKQVEQAPPPTAAQVKVPEG